MSVTPDQLARISDRHTERSQAVLVRLLRLLLGLWRPFDAWTDEDLVRARAARSATLVESASAQVYLLAREYIRQVAIADGREVTDLPAADDPLYPRRNVTALDVYTRPAEQFRYARSIG